MTGLEEFLETKLVSPAYGFPPQSEEMCGYWRALSAASMGLQFSNPSSYPLR